MWTLLASLTVVGQEFLIPSHRRRLCVRAILGFGALATALLLALAVRMTKERATAVLPRCVRTGTGPYKVTMGGFWGRH